MVSESGGTKLPSLCTMAPVCPRRRGGARSESCSCQDGEVATRKPIPAEYQIHDRRFLDLIVPGAELHHLHAGGLWAEGPVYLPASDVLLWSDVRRNRCMRLDVATGEVSLHMQPANFNNGHTRDPQGRVSACEHGTRSVVRFERDDTRTVLADRFEGKRFNSPN